MGAIIQMAACGVRMIANRYETMRRKRLRRSGPRAKSTAVKQITRESLRVGRLMYPSTDVERPRTRGECEPLLIPCPWCGVVVVMRIYVEDEIAGHGTAARPPVDPGTDRQRRELRARQLSVDHAKRTSAKQVIVCCPECGGSVWIGRRVGRVDGYSAEHDHNALTRGVDIGTGRSGANAPTKATTNDERRDSVAERVVTADRYRGDDHRGEIASRVDGRGGAHDPSLLMRCRPCAFVSCKHHMALDISPETGSIKINFPDLDPSEMMNSCSLDVADRGGLTLEEVGDMMNLTRERIRQIEVCGLLKLKRAPPYADELGAGLEPEQKEDS